MAFRSLEKLINLHDGYRRAFRVSDGEVLLLQEGGQRWLIGRYCPHAGQALDAASIDERAITCPRHGYCFSLDSGEPLEAPCEPLATVALVYEGNSIGVEEFDA